jgi:hypothetical protein
LKQQAHSHYGFFANCHRAAKLDLGSQWLAKVLFSASSAGRLPAASAARKSRQLPAVPPMWDWRADADANNPTVFRFRSNPRGQLMTPSGWNPPSRHRCPPRQGTLRVCWRSVWAVMRLGIPEFLAALRQAKARALEVM